MVFTRIVFQISCIIYNIHVTKKNRLSRKENKMKDLIINTLMHDTSFGQSLSAREKVELLLHSGARKRTINRAKEISTAAAGLFTRSKELHKRKIEAMLD